MPKPRYKTTNWKQYNKALINRGSLTFWIDEEAIRRWKQSKQDKRGGSFEFEVNEVPEGSYTYKITATDAAGNESINSLEGKIVVDKSITNFSATMSSESDSGSYDDDKVTNVKLPKFSGTGEPGSSITISISKGGESILPSYGPAVVNESGDWEYIVPDSLVDCGYEAKFTITDLAGNTAETSFAFIIDSVSEFSAEMVRIADSELADGITRCDGADFAIITVGADHQLIGKEQCWFTLTQFTVFRLAQVCIAAQLVNTCSHWVTAML